MSAIDRERVARFLHGLLDLAIKDYLLNKMGKDFEEARRMMQNLAAMTCRPAKHSIDPKECEDSALAAHRGLGSLCEKLNADMRTMQETFERDKHNAAAAWRDLTTAEREVVADVTDDLEPMMCAVRAEYFAKFAPSKEVSS